MSDTALVSLLAAAIALLGVGIAWGQWWTARQKLVIDLFDKRYAAYQAFRAADAHYNGQGYDDVNAWFQVAATTHEMEYLFGVDVAQTLGRIRREGLRDHQTRRLLRREDLSNERRETLSIEQETASNAYHYLLRDLHEALMPYLRMNQRLPRSPRQWLADKGRDRPDGT